MSTAPTSIDARLHNIEQSLAKTGKKLKRGSIVTCVVGIALLAVVLGYFVFGYTQIKDLFKAEILVPYATDMVDERIPVLLNSAKETVVTSAPQWAQMVSDQAIAYIPQGRQQLQTFILSKADEGIDKVVVLGEDKMKTIIAEHRAEFQDAFKQLASDEGDAKEAVAVVTKALGDELGRDMKDQAHELMHTMIALRERLERLRDNQALVKDETLERNIIMTIKHLQIRENEKKADMAVVPVSNSDGT